MSKNSFSTFPKNYNINNKIGCNAMKNFVSTTIGLSGYSLSKTINITGQSGAGTDYQILVKVGESSGSTGSDFNLSSMANSFPSAENTSGDIRFTSSDKVTLLDCWVEKVTGTTPNRIAYFWVKVKEDLSTNKTIYCYYKGDTTNYCNGNNVFLFFDDFSSGNLSKWTSTGNGGYSVANGYLLCTSASNDCYLTANTPVGTGGFIIESRVRSNASTTQHPGIEWHANTSTGTAHRNDHIYMRPHAYNTTTNIQPAYYNGTLNTFGNVTGLFNYNTWYDIKIVLTDASNIKYYRDGVNEVNFASQQFPTNTYVGCAYHGTSEANWDNYRVRKYCATEPTISSVL